GNSTFSKLIPFVATVILYFSLIQHTDRHSTPSTVLKCIPIFSLIFYVMLTKSDVVKLKEYQSRIFYGLVFSSVGDFLLNYDLFEAGMGAFGIAQICYIWAFGTKPKKIWIGLILYMAGFLAIALFFKNLNIMIQICLPFYAILLLTMCWRSLARIEGSDTYIMVTYYLAQVGITLSINDPKLYEASPLMENSTR
uniref:lysoplasmalogenase n=1 Tax=Anopheles christyi TaxID=43041 RepID=A0A182K4N3_9DIPT